MLPQLILVHPLLEVRILSLRQVLLKVKSLLKHLLSSFETGVACGLIIAQW